MKPNSLFRLSALVSAFISTTWWVSADKILVVIEDGIEQSAYQQLWSSLGARNHQLSFRPPKDATPVLMEFNEPSFDHLILFSPTTKSFPADLSPQNLVEFLEQGGNILLAGSTNISEYWRDFAREFDLDFDDRTTSVIDNFSHLDQDPLTPYATLDPTPLIEDEVVIPASLRGKSSPVLFRGIGHAIGKNPLLMSVLRASPLAYSADAKSGESDPNRFIMGDEIGLVSAFQTKKQSRILFCGSVEFFSDQFSQAQITLPDGKEFVPFQAKIQPSSPEPFAITSAANRKVSDHLTKWVFQEAGVLRILSATHSQVTGAKEPKRYRVNEQIAYSVDIQLLQNGRWGPCPMKDVQLDFTMLDPHLRVTLEPSKSKNHTTYSTVFRAPDRHGVFTFKLDYRRRTGYTYLERGIKVAVTPPEHDQYDRFILGAYPYYTGALSVLASFILFSCVWLTHSPGTATTNGKKSK